jgi:hypothetical protein
MRNAPSKAAKPPPPTMHRESSAANYKTPSSAHAAGWGRESRACRSARGRDPLPRQYDRGFKLRRKHEAKSYSLRMLHYGVSSGRLHVTIPRVAPWLPVQSAGLLQSVCPPARRFVPIVRGCAREGYGRSRSGYPTRAQRRLRLKPIVNRRWWHGARMRDGTRILSMQSQCNRVSD